mmetsp:Transcript_114123/g.295521  ORF Transcript_114123/g.295521 Transcript_114123/m.295521 type:complete len:212 (+) Transcript_114123:2187-2822(+)
MRCCCDGKLLDQDRACGSIHDECQHGNTPSKEEYTVGNLLLKQPSRPVHTQLDRKCQTNGSTKPTPSHDRSFCHRDGRSIRAKPLQHGARGEQHSTADSHHDHVDEQEMQVVNQIDAHHGLAAEGASEKKDDCVADILDGVPHLMHCLLAYDLWPDGVCQHKTCSHIAKHTADTDDALSKDKRPICAAKRETDLNHTTVVLEAVTCTPDPR